MIRAPGLFLLAVCAAGRLAAQSAAPEVFAGSEFRSLRLGAKNTGPRVSQIVVPIGVVIPIGRFTLDLGTSWASTRLKRADGSRHDVDAFTDSQLRGSYIFGHDAVVATMLLNLPTGLDEASVRDYTVIGAVSPSLLGFPVASYASGFSVTSGLAAAVPAGDWSIGLAGSVRMNSRFTPYVDATGPITYKAGVETRLRGALDGLVGSSRLSFGFTYSTFGDDQFGKALAVSSRGRYSPGPRWIAEAALAAPVGGSTLSMSVWNYRRSAGDTTGASALNKENLAAADLSWLIPVSRSVALEPQAQARMSKPETGKGKLIGAGLGLRFQLGDAVTFSPSLRYDTGWIKDPNGVKNDLRGGYGSAFLRVLF